MNKSVRKTRGDHTDLSAQNIACCPVGTYYEAARITDVPPPPKKRFVYVGLAQARPNYATSVMLQHPSLLETMQQCML